MPSQMDKNQMQKCITVFKKARKRILPIGSEPYLASLSNESILLQRLVENGFCSRKESITNLKKAINSCKTIRRINKGKHATLFNISLLEEGSSLGKLANYDENPKKKLNTALRLLKKSRLGFEKINDDFGYALTLMNEAIVRRNLATLSRDPDNLERSIKLSEDARKKGLPKGSPYYAKTLMNQGAAIIELGQLQNIGDLINKLNGAISLISEARNCFTKGSSDYSTSLIEEGKARLLLTDLGIEQELNHILCLFVDARKDIPVDVPEYAASLIEEGICLLKISETESRMDAIGSINKAIDKFREVQDISDKTPFYVISLVEEGIARSLLAKMRIQQKSNLKIAVKIFNKAKNMQIVKDPSVGIGNLNYAVILMNEGTTRLKLADIGDDAADNLLKAEKLLIEAKKIFSEQDDKIYLTKSYIALGDFYYLKDEMDEAYSLLKDGIKLIETMRSSIGIPEVRRDYFETVIVAYDIMIFTCIALKKFTEAFKYAEASKGRLLLESLIDGNRQIKGDPELISKYEDVSKSIDGIESEIFNMNQRFRLGEDIDHDHYDKLNLSIIPLVKQQDKLLLKIKHDDPEYFDVKTVEPVSIADINLGDKTLIEYYLGKELAIFILNDDLNVEVLHIDQKEVLDNFVELRNIIENNDDVSKGEDLLQYFYNILIKPVESKLTNEIIIVPHKYLHAIPFLALKSDNYLIENHQVSFAQSASSLKYLKSGKGTGALVVGNPTGDLVHSEYEAKEISILLKTKPLIGKDAQKENILFEMENKEIIHFACHGSFSLFNPALAGLKVTDGIIRIKDIVEINLSANLIVLSTCNSGLGVVNLGDEYEGFVRAMQYVGCRFVIASLWEVQDDSTKELFLHFYNKDGSFVDKLRNAQIELMKDYDFDKWAAFQIYGI